MLYLGEIIALSIAIIAAFIGIACAYLLIRHVHRKWWREDEEMKARHFREMREELRQEGIDLSGTRFDADTRGNVYDRHSTTFNDQSRGGKYN